MSLHRLTSVTIGVPNVDETVTYYEEFGLTHHGDGSFSTADGGQQLRIASSSQRRLLEIGIGVDDPDDVDRIATQLDKLDLATKREGTSLVTEEPIAGFRATVSVSPHIEQASDPTPYNFPGRIEREGRAPGVLREGPVKPRKLGHVVIGSTDQEATQRFFTEASASRSATVSQAWPRSCAARPTTTTSWCSSAGELPAPHLVAGRGH